MVNDSTKRVYADALFDILADNENIEDTIFSDFQSTQELRLEHDEKTGEYRIDVRSWDEEEDCEPWMTIEIKFRENQ